MFVCFLETVFIFSRRFLKEKFANLNSFFCCFLCFSEDDNQQNNAKNAYQTQWLVYWKTPVV